MTTPQQPFFSTQDIVSPDIDLYYTKVIKQIDQFRSTFDGITSNLSQTISLKKLDSVFSDNEANSLSPQESRCSAFFRMIGFPVVSGDGSSLYSPGFDPGLNMDQVRIAKNIDIANSLIKKAGMILQSREVYAKNSINIFSNKDDNATALAMSSMFPRPFDKQLKAGLGPLDLDSQAFEVPSRASISLSFGNPVTFSQKSTHILKPFVVDPRIEFTVTPGSNRICAPFIKKSQTQLSRGKYLKNSYINTVLSVRFNKSNVLSPPQGQSEINQFVKDLITLIQSNPDITDKSLVDIVANPLQSLHQSEIFVFNKFIKILQAFMLELANSITQLNKIRTRINWKPIPSSNGPEFGSTLQSVDSSDIGNNQILEVNISTAELNKFLRQTDFDIGTSAPDLANSIFSDIDDVVFASTQHNYQFYDQQINSLNRQRNELGNTANQLLRRIEILTGEFSGIGLIDIFAIKTALWIISPEALLGLIDDAAIARMKSDDNLRTDVSKLPPLEALSEFEKKLSGIYVLINSFYQDIFDFNGKNNQ